MGSAPEGLNGHGRADQSCWPMNRMGRGVLCLTVACGSAPIQQEASPLLVLNTTIPLPGVSGRIDHLAVDGTGHRVFIAALGNNSVEVVDLITGAHLASMTDIKEPQGIVFIPEDRSVLV